VPQPIAIQMSTGGEKNRGPEPLGAGIPGLHPAARQRLKEEITRPSPRCGLCVMNERVARAKELLLRGQLLVEIAAVLGFANQSHFRGVFRKATGMSPGRFRREHQ
jgi:hypothetical protein